MLYYIFQDRFYNCFYFLKQKKIMIGKIKNNFNLLNLLITFNISILHFEFI